MEIRHVSPSFHSFEIELWENENVGWIKADILDLHPTHVYLHQFWVVPKFRNQGRGTYLLQYTEKHLKKGGFTRIRVLNHKLFSLYGKLGYRWTGQSKIMEKIL